MKKRINCNKKGFTLIEVMTALSIFAVVMTISMGAILGVFDANRKSESLKTVMDNLNFTMETMGREMRFGKNYHCGNGGSILTPLNCSSIGLNGGATQMVFTTQDGHYIQYQYRSDLKLIEKSVDGNTFISMTSPEVTITGGNFIVVGAETGDGQARVFMQVKGYAGSKLNTQSNFTLQTLVTQRSRDK